MRDHPQAMVVKLCAHEGCESLCWFMFFPESAKQDCWLQKLGTWNYGKWREKRERERENDHVVLNVASLSHAHTDVLCVIGGIVFPLPLGIAGKVSLPVSTHSNHTERVAQGCCLPQTRGGTQRKPSTLSSHCSGGVNLSGICWESGGNLLSPFLCLLASSFHV